MQTLDYAAGGNHDSSWSLVCGGVRLRAAPQVRVCAVYTRWEREFDWDYMDSDEFMLYQASEHVSRGLLQSYNIMSPTPLCHVISCSFLPLHTRLQSPTSIQQTASVYAHKGEGCRAGAEYMVEVHEGMAAALRQGIEDAGLSTSHLSDGKLIGLLIHAALSPHSDWKPRLPRNDWEKVRMGIIRPPPKREEDEEDGTGYRKDWRYKYDSVDRPVAYIVAADDKGTILPIDDVTHVTIVVPSMRDLWESEKEEHEEYARKLVNAAWQGLRNVFPGVSIEAVKRRLMR